MGDLAVVRSEGERLIAGGGATNAVCLHEARAARLGGFEFACAIPGTAGGGVRIRPGRLQQRLVADPPPRARRRRRRGRLAHPGRLGLSYRHSELRPGQVVAEVEYRLVSRPSEQIKETVRDLIAQRKATQPTNKRTFGSVFKNPEHELGAGPYARGVRAQGPPPRRRDDLADAQLHRECGDATTADALGADRRGAPPRAEQFGVELEHEVQLLHLDRRHVGSACGAAKPSTWPERRISEPLAPACARGKRCSFVPAPRLGRSPRAVPPRSLRPLAADRAADPARRPRPLRRRAHDLRVRRRPDRGRRRAPPEVAADVRKTLAPARLGESLLRVDLDDLAGRAEGVPRSRAFRSTGSSRTRSHSPSSRRSRSRSSARARRPGSPRRAAACSQSSSGARVPACPASGSGAAST